MCPHPSHKMLDRRSLFRGAAVNAEAARKRREDALAQIRQNQRNETLLKRRTVHPANVHMGDSLADLVAVAFSGYNNAQIGEATRILRALLSTGGILPIVEVERSSVFSRLVQFLRTDQLASLQLGAVGVLTNIFVRILNSPSPDVPDKAIRALGSIAGVSSEFRDTALSFGALVPLLTHLIENSKSGMRKAATSTLSIFCSGSPEPPFEQIKPAVSVLRSLLFSTDDDFLSDACRALSCLSDGDDCIRGVIEAGVCPKLVELLNHQSPTVYTHALRTIMNITAVDHNRSQLNRLEQLPLKLHEI